jgi:hypothetical protein
MKPIKDILQDFFNFFLKQEELYTKQCTVKSVDESKRVLTASPIDGGPDIINVRIEAKYDIDTNYSPIASDPQGVLIVPEVGSIVLVTFLNKNDAYISAFTTITKIISKQTEFIFNDGTNEGLVKVIELTDKLNNLENAFNDLVTKYNSHIHVTTATVGATPTPGVISPTTSTEPTVLTPTVKADIENTEVKH